MDQRIIALESSTFSGRRLNRQQIADIQETVALLPNDSRNELARSASISAGRRRRATRRVGACLGMLETLEIHGILTLPPREDQRPRHDVDAGLDLGLRPPAGDRCAAVRAASASRRACHRQRGTAAVKSALVDRHHYLGYRRPFGAHVLYFVTDRDGRRLGCLLFDAVTKRLPCRDRWIGWKGSDADRRRRLMVVDSRFLVFPWVRSKYLASSALALATAAARGDDWERLHGWRRCVRDLRRRDPLQGLVIPGGQLGAHRGDGRHRKVAQGRLVVKTLCEGARDILRGEGGKPAKPPTRSERGRFGLSKVACTSARRRS